MTHDELLERIKEFEINDRVADPITYSLYAIMDLHAPTNIVGGKPICHECYLGEDDGFAYYPCSTIKQILRVIGE